MGTDSPVSMDWSSRISPPVSFTSAATTAPSESFTTSPGTSSAAGIGLPCTVASDRCIQREPRLQRGKGRLGAALLEQPECGVEHQETGDDRGLDILAERQLEHDRSLKHPRNGRPEFLERHAQRMQRRVGHGVRAELLQPAARFVASSGRSAG